MFAPIHPLRIIVADDEPFILEYYRHVLPALGHRCIGTATNGQELVDACGAGEPELVITDVNMPGMDGIEAARRICLQQAIPIILVSGHYSGDFLEQTQRDVCHVTAWLLKPVKLETLENTIELALDKFRKQNP